MNVSWKMKKGTALVRPHAAVLKPRRIEWINATHFKS
jgi:hypothetical protein